MSENEVMVLVLMGFIFIAVLTTPLYRFFDTLFQSKQCMRTTIILKTTRPEHVYLLEETPMADTAHQSSYLPPNWTIYVKINGAPCALTVDEEMYDRIQVGDNVNACYVLGRMSHTPYLVSIFGYICMTT